MPRNRPPTRAELRQYQTTLPQWAEALSLMLAALGDEREKLLDRVEELEREVISLKGANAQYREEHAALRLRGVDMPAAPQLDLTAAEITLPEGAPAYVPEATEQPAMDTNKMRGDIDAALLEYEERYGNSTSTFLQACRVAGGPDNLGALGIAGIAIEEARGWYALAIKRSLLR